MTKLYLVVRGDLSPGQQAVQAAHALQEFNVRYPSECNEWYRDSNTLAFLAARDEESLGILWAQADSMGLPCAPFYEPDRANELTAVAFSPDCRKLLQRLPTALRCRSVA